MSLLSRSRQAGREDTRSATRKIFAGGLWNQLTSVLPMAVSIVMTPYLIHGLGVARWGLFLLVLSATAFLGQLNGGLGATAERFFAVAAGRDDRFKATQTLWTLLLILLVLGLAASAVGYFVAPTIIGLFHVQAGLREEGIFLFRSLGCIVGFTFLHNLFAAAITAHQRYAFINVTYVLTYLVWVAGLILTVERHLGLRGVAIVFICQQAISTLAIVPAACRFLTIRGLHLLSAQELKEVIRYSLGVQGAAVVELINIQIAGLIVGWRFSVTKLAYYSSGAGFATNVRELANNASSPLLTHLAQIVGRHGEDAAEEEFRRVQRVWVIGSTGFSAVAIGSSYFAVVAWLGPRFVPAGWVALIASVNGAIITCTAALKGYIAAIGRPDLDARFTLVALILNVVLTVPLIIFVGFYGVPLATAGATALATARLMRLVRRRYRSTVPGFLREVPILPGCLAGGTTAALELCIRGLVPDGPLGLLACAVPAAVGLVVFAVAILRGSLFDILGSLRRPNELKPKLLYVLLAPR